MPEPIAIWNSARDVWETPGTEGFFCEHLDVFSETFPTSGMTVNGAAYELDRTATRDLGSRMLDLVTLDSASLSLLLTPVASEGEKATFQQTSARRAQTGQPFLTNQIRDIYELNQLGPKSSRATTGECREMKMLPTPKASDGEKGGPNQRGSSGDYMLPSAVIHLLPTPVAQPSGNTPENHLRKKPGRQVATDLAILTENGLLETGGRVHLLPTPTVGMMMGGSQTRSGSRSGEPLLPGVAKQIGESTNQLSAAGSTSSDVQLPGQLNLLDAITDTD